MRHRGGADEGRSAKHNRHSVGSSSPIMEERRNDHSKSKGNKDKKTSSVNDLGFLNELALVVLLTSIAAATRFYRLGEPNEVVFDEVHFGGFTVNYLKGEYFFDIHPPLGKLALAASGWFVGIGNYSSTQFERIGTPFPDDAYVGARAVPALFSTLTTPIVFFISREMGRSIAASLLVASLFVADGMILVTSRLIVTDALLWFAGMLTLYCGLRFWRAESEAGKGSLSWWGWCIMTGIVMGLTVSVKWTGLGFVATAGLPLALQALRHFTSFLRELKEYYENDTTTKKKNKRQPIPNLILWGVTAGVTMIAVMTLIYLATWVIHFSVLTQTGPGNIWHAPRFLSSLQGSGHDTGEGGGGHVPYTMWEKIVEIHQKMFDANKNLQTGHSYGSAWYNWPMMEKSMSYWVKHIRGLGSAKVMLQGNAAVFACTSLVTLFMIVGVVCTWTRWDDTSLADQQRQSCLWASWLLFGYAINILPYILVTRVCFFYHYAPSLLFAMLLSGLAFDKYFPPIERAMVVGGVISCCLIFFVSNAPLHYAQFVA